MPESSQRAIWWVRHGPTHAEGMVGWSDLPADLGDRAALARLSAALPADLPVVYSDLARARATATAIAGGRPCLPADARLREMHFGDWERRLYRELDAETPGLLRGFLERPGDIRPPGGESWNDLAARVRPAVEELLEAHGRLIAVAHFGVILTELQHALGIAAKDAFGFRIDALSVTRIDYAPARGAPVVNHRP